MDKGRITGRALALAFVAAAVSSAQAAPAEVAIPGEKVFPESLTSTSDGTLYVGSIVDGGIQRVAPGATTAEPWLAPAAHGTRSIFGVLADEGSGTLWACSNDVSGFGIPSPGDAPGSTLKGFDLATGALKSSAALPGEHPFCNDIAVGPDGRVYASDVLASQVLRLTPDGTGFEVWTADAKLTPAPGGAGVDGLVFGSDGALYLTTFGKGELFRVAVGPDGAAGEVTPLVPSRALTLPDAIRLVDGNRFLLIEGGGSLDLVTVDGDKAEIQTLADGFVTPVSVTQVGDTAWVAEGQLGLLFDPAQKDKKPNLPFRVVPVPLAAP